MRSCIGEKANQGSQIRKKEEGPKWCECESSRRKIQTFKETVLELPGEGLHVPHAASSGGPPANGLSTPVVGPLPGVRVTARSAGLLLDVVRALVAATADGVGLRQVLSLAGSSLGLQEQQKKEKKGLTDVPNELPFLNCFVIQLQYNCKKISCDQVLNMLSKWMIAWSESSFNIQRFVGYGDINIPWLQDVKWNRRKKEREKKKKKRERENWVFEKGNKFFSVFFFFFRFKKGTSQSTRLFSSSEKINLHLPMGKKRNYEMKHVAEKYWLRNAAWTLSHRPL